MHQRRCRICLKKSMNVKSLLDICIDKPEVNLLKVYNKCTQTRASSEDALPQFLCFNCCDELQRFFKFRARARKAQQKYRKKLELLLQTKEKQPLVQVDEDDQKLNGIFDVFTVSNNEKNYKIEDTAATEQDQADNAAAAFTEYLEFSPLIDEEQEIEMLDATIIEGNIKPYVETEASPFASELSNEAATELKNISDVEQSTSWKTGANLWPGLLQNYELRQLQQCESCQRHFISETNYMLHMHTCQPMPTHSSTKQSTSFPPGTTTSDMEYQNCLSKNLFSAGAYAFRRKLELRAALRKTIEASLLQNGSQCRKPRKKKIEAHICKICGKQFKTDVSVRQHQNVHREKEFICSVCPKQFLRLSQLRRHMTAHTGERPYQCTHCGLKFRLQNTFNNHVRFHTRDYRYECVPCKRHFIQWSAWNHHNKLHHEEKEFACLHCDKKYARKIDLKVHLQVHADEYSFHCNYCTKVYRYKASLKMHLERHHADEVFKDDGNAM